MTSKILTLSAATALALAVPASARAQNVWFGDHGRYESGRQYYEDARRIAQDNGYREGLKHGEDAARRGRPFDLAREKDYRNGDEGYNRRYGSKEEYREAYRNGFAQGYREAYERSGYGVRGEGYGLYAPRPEGTTGRLYGGVYVQGGSIAFRNGESDGYQKGLDDARHGRYPDMNRQKWYRNGDHGYDDDRDGSRDAYRVEYRRGFEDGYRRAFGAR
jgi:hypothetical protein